MRATYGSDSESNGESSPPRSIIYADSRQVSNPRGSEGLPPPPIDLLQTPNFLGMVLSSYEFSFKKLID